MRNERYILLPKWIRFFSWIFLLFFLSPLGFLTVLFHKPMTFTLFGFYYRGSPFDAPAIVIQLLLLFFASSAYALLWGRWVGVRLGLICGYLGLAICIAAMVITYLHHDLRIQIEPIIQIPFIVALTRIRHDWESQDQI